MKNKMEKKSLQIQTALLNSVLFLSLHCTFCVIKNVPSIQDRIWRVGKRGTCSLVNSDPLREEVILQTEVFKLVFL